METKVITRIVTETDKIEFGYWDEEKDEWVDVTTTDEIVDAAKKLNCSPDLITALVSIVEIIKERVGEDLADLWKRLDDLEA